MIRLGKHRRQLGFSLVELSVVMVIVGVIGLLTWRWIASTREPLQRPAILSQLAEAQAALEGFVLAMDRLPCPAADASGVENCASTSIYLPWRALGLSSRFGQLHYGVNQGGVGLDLTAQPLPWISPDLMSNFDEIPQLVVADPDLDAAVARVRAAITSAIARRTQVNGLDWCRTLRKLAANPWEAGVLKVGNSSSEIPVAYVLVHPGMNNIFEGSNVVGSVGGWKFDFPGRAQTHDFDDVSIATGPADLSARIGCTARLSGMRAAAQGAFTAYDNARLGQEYWSLRVFDIEQAESALSGAQSGVAMAALSLALATAGEALGLASAANTEGITLADFPLLIVNLGLAVNDVKEAAADLIEAQEALQASKDKANAVRTYVIHLYDTFAEALNTSVLLDQKGLNP